MRVSRRVQWREARRRGVGGCIGASSDAAAGSVSISRCPALAVTRVRMIQADSDRLADNCPERDVSLAAR
jgi:hypothetical protein